MAEDIVNYAIENKKADPVAFLKQTFQPEEISTVPAASPAPIVSHVAAKRAKNLHVAKTDEAPNLDSFYQMDDYIKTKTRKSAPACSETLG